jgi:hypothetical protein
MAWYCSWSMFYDWEMRKTKDGRQNNVISIIVNQSANEALQSRNFYL